MGRKSELIIGYVINRINLLRYGVNVANSTHLRGKINFYCSNKQSILIGNNCIINSGIPFNQIGGDHITVLRTEAGGKITIGNNVGISNSAIVSFSHIDIEDDVMIGGDCKVFDSDFHSIYYEQRMLDTGAKAAPIKICKGAFIGCSSIVLKGVTIGKYAVIGAGSVVTNSIPPRELWAGNPARFIKRIEVLEE